MVGLSVVLEAAGQKHNTSFVSKKTPQVINKVFMMKPSSSPSSSYKKWELSSTTTTNYSSNSSSLPLSSSFLDRCFLCKKKLLSGNDIYMYKGDRAFCSVECRCTQICMDEEETDKNDDMTAKEETVKRDICPLPAMRPRSTVSSSSSPSSSRTNRKGARNPANRFPF